MGDQERTEIKVNIHDAGAIKRALDDSLTGYLNTQYVEDHSISNIKILTSALCCLVAGTAQFYPVPFPDNYWLLVICCIAYFSLSGMLQYIAMYQERDFVFISKKLGDRASAVQVRTRLPRFEYDYSVSIAERSTGRGETTLTKVVGNWFDSNGVLHENLFIDDVKKIIEQYKNKLKRE